MNHRSHAHHNFWQQTLRLALLSILGLFTSVSMAAPPAPPPAPPPVVEKPTKVAEENPISSRNIATHYNSIQVNQDGSVIIRGQSQASKSVEIVDANGTPVACGISEMDDAAGRYYPPINVGQEKQICFYTDENYSGDEDCLERYGNMDRVVDGPNIKNFLGTNFDYQRAATYKSVKVPENAEVRLFREVRYNGFAYTGENIDNEDMLILREDQPSIPNLLAKNKFSAVGSIQTGPASFVGDGVCLYTETDFSGEEVCFGTGVDIHVLSRIYNDSKGYNSIRVGERTSVRLFSSYNWAGRSVEVREDVSDLSTIGFENYTATGTKSTPTSMQTRRIHADTTMNVCFYDDVDLESELFCVPAGTQDSDIDTDDPRTSPDNRITSISIPDGLELQVFFEQDFRDGREDSREGVTLTGEVNDLSAVFDKYSRSLDNEVSSYKISAAPLLEEDDFEVCFYPDKEYGGTPYCIADYANIRDLGPPLSDTFESVTVRGKVKVSIYTNADYERTRETFTESKPVLDLSNRIHSLQVMPLVDNAHASDNLNNEALLSNPDAICFYTELNFQGEPYCLAVNAEIAYLPTYLRNAFRSLRLGENVEVHAYDAADFRGEVNEFSRASNRFDKITYSPVDSRIESLRVLRRINQKICFYDKYKKTSGVSEGYSAFDELLCLSANESASRIDVEHLDRISAVSIPTGFENFQVEFYSEPDFQGEREVLGFLEGDEQGLTALNDKVQSVKLSRKICFYQHRNYEGEKHCVNSSELNGDFTADFNKEISSVTMPDDMQVTLHSNPSQSGKSITLTQNTPDLSEFSRQASSYSLQRQAVCVYSETQFKGNKHCLDKAGNLNLNLSAKIKSIYIPPGQWVQLYAGINLSGADMTVVDQSNAALTQGLNARSLRIYRDTACLYRKADIDGLNDVSEMVCDSHENKAFKLAGADSLAMPAGYVLRGFKAEDHLGDWSDMDWVGSLIFKDSDEDKFTLKSFKVFPSKVCLHEDKNFSGERLCLGRSVRSLPSNWDKNAESINVPSMFNIDSYADADFLSFMMNFDAETHRSQLANIKPLFDGNGLSSIKINGFPYQPGFECRVPSAAVRPIKLVVDGGNGENEELDISGLLSVHIDKAQRSNGTVEISAQIHQGDTTASVGLFDTQNNQIGTCTPSEIKGNGKVICSVQTNAPGPFVIRATRDKETVETQVNLPVTGKPVVSTVNGVTTITGDASKGSTVTSADANGKPLSCSPTPVDENEAYTCVGTDVVVPVKVTIVDAEGNETTHELDNVAGDTSGALTIKTLDKRNGLITVSSATEYQSVTVNYTKRVPAATNTVSEEASCVVNGGMARCTVPETVTGTVTIVGKSNSGGEVSVENDLKLIPNITDVKTNGMTANTTTTISGYTKGLATYSVNDANGVALKCSDADVQVTVDDEGKVVLNEQGTPVFVENGQQANIDGFFTCTGRNVVSPLNMNARNQENTIVATHQQSITNFDLIVTGVRNLNNVLSITALAPSGSQVSVSDNQGTNTLTSCTPDPVPATGKVNCELSSASLPSQVLKVTAKTGGGTTLEILVNLNDSPLIGSLVQNGSMITATIKAPPNSTVNLVDANGKTISCAEKPAGSGSYECTYNRDEFTPKQITSTDVNGNTQVNEFAKELSDDPKRLSDEDGPYVEGVIVNATTVSAVTQDNKPLTCSKVAGDGSFNCRRSDLAPSDVVTIKAYRNGKQISTLIK